MEIRGKVAIVTGAGSGIGRATAVRLAAEGAKVVVVDINDAGSAETVAAIKSEGGEASALHCDVTTSTDIDAMFSFAERTYGGFDILHNNAGVTTGQPRFPECGEDVWMRVIKLDLIAVIESVRKAIPLLKKRGGGVIISTASVAGLFGFAADPVYSSAKHGVVGLTRALAGLKDEANIRINCVCPGVVNTPLVMHGVADMKPEAKAEWDRVVSAMPMIPPEDVAQGVVELILDDEATGQAMGIIYNQPHRIVPPPVNLPITSGDISKLPR
jgi:NAD(P)-dependent dehydrogenase (short-subunit alcohol dehydrogenase family)